MHRDLRIVFMGTPDFAVPSLDILVQHNYTIAGVITAPDKPAGRGQQIQQSAVKRYAVEKGLKVLQPLKLKDDQFIQELSELNANLFVVVAFRMLPEKVWQMPEYGTFNLHASLLPQYRGAAPINWAVINGEKETGVTTFFLQHAIDTGNIIFQDKTAILPEDNAGSVHDKLMKLGSELVLKTVQAIESNTVMETPQPSAPAKHAPKLFKEDCRIHWNKTAIEIHNLIRGLSPYPAAFTEWNEKVMKLFSSGINTVSIPEGSTVIRRENLLTDNKTFIRFQCADGYIDILELQLEGKKRMKTEEFLRGYKF